MEPIKAKERATLAALIERDEQFIYQCLTGRRQMDATMASRLEKLSAGRVRRWDVRRDWAETWPELVGIPGAPKVVKVTRTSRAKKAA